MINQPSYTKLVVLAACFGVAGCYKEYSENFVEEEIITQNAAIGQQLADDAMDIVYQAEVMVVVQKKSLPDGPFNFPGNVGPCGVISDDSINKILTINYDTGCVDVHFRTHSGTITVAYAGILGDSVADRLITFDHYVVNQKKVEGTIGLHNFETLPDGAFVADRTLTDLKITFPNGTGVTFNGTHHRVWTSGRGDSLATNNRYTFRGSMNGTSSTGRSFTQDINTPVIADFYCSSLGFFARTYGVVELSKLEGYPDRKRTVDYGSDSTKYDNTVTVTTFRRTYGVTTD